MIAMCPCNLLPLLLFSLCFEFLCPFLFVTHGSNHKIIHATKVVLWLSCRTNEKNCLCATLGTWSAGEHSSYTTKCGAYLPPQLCPSTPKPNMHTWLSWVYTAESTSIYSGQTRSQWWGFHLPRWGSVPSPIFHSLPTFSTHSLLQTHSDSPIALSLFLPHLAFFL